MPDRLQMLPFAERRSWHDRAVVSDEGDRADPVLIEDSGGQWPPKHGAGGKVEAIGEVLDLADSNRRVTMNDILTVVARIRKERFADPEHHVLLLLFERHAGSDAGMHVETLAIADRKRKILEPRQVFRRDGVDMGDAIAVECLM